MEIKIRPATHADLPSLLEIYNEAVLNTTATFDTEIKSLANREEWFKNRNENFPVLVAVNTSVVGYASLSRWSDKKAYDITAEISVYIHSEHRKKGLGDRLISEILKAALKTNLHSIIARITEGNDHSVYLHKKYGFSIIGIMKEAGEKFDKKLDVTFMQKMLRS